MKEVIYKYFMLLRTAKENGNWSDKQVYKKALNQFKKYFPIPYKEVRNQIYKLATNKH